jgi:hypothetical protein
MYNETRGLVNKAVESIYKARNVMSEIRIVKDGQVNRQQTYLTGLLFVAVLLAFNWVLGFSTTSLLAGGVVGVIGWMLLIKGRSSWGQSIVFNDKAMSVEKTEGIVFQINASSITAATIKPTAIMIAWNDNGGRKSLVIGSESFLDPTWSRLVASFEDFVPNELLNKA